MALDRLGSFPFLRLPSEIRNKVYSILLCSIQPLSKDLSIVVAPNVPSLDHSIETTILRTSKQVHREAYDVMVKGNKFVNVKSSCCVPFINSLTPVVSANEDAVARFPGYVLAVELHTKNIDPLEHVDDQRYRPFNVMMFAKHIDLLCRALADGDAYITGFTKNLSITLTVAPDPLQTTKYKDSLSEFFSEKTQKELLAPFRETLHGLQDVQLRGDIDRTLAKAVQQDLAQDAWTDAQAMLSKIVSMKELGSSCFRSRGLQEASLHWQDAALELELILESNSWNRMVSRGGTKFLSEVSELYFTLKLNIAHVQLMGIQNPKPGFFAVHLMVQDALGCAKKSTKKDFWTDGFKFTPTKAQWAKMCYRAALCFRLEGNAGSAPVALQYIKLAARNAPGDVIILKEQRNIEAWVNDVS